MEQLFASKSGYSLIYCCQNGVTFTTGLGVLCIHIPTCLIVDPMYSTGWLGYPFSWYDIQLQLYSAFGDLDDISFPTRQGADLNFLS